MFNPDDIKKVYEQNYSTCMELVKTNTNAVKDYMAFQSEMVEEFLKESNNSLSTAGSIKNPQDFENFLKESQSNLEAKLAAQSKKYLELCQNYQAELTKVVEQFSDNSAELVKKAKKS